MNKTIPTNENDVNLPEPQAEGDVQNKKSGLSCLRLFLVLLTWAVLLLFIVGWKAISILDTYTMGFAVITLVIMLIPQFIFPNKRCKQLLLFVFLVLGGISIMIFALPPVWIGSTTTFVTEPLKSDGTIDYFQALANNIQPTLKPDDNGITLLARAAGKPLLFHLHFGITETDLQDGTKPIFRVVANRYWSQLCKTLNLDPKLTPTVSYIPPREYHLSYQYLGYEDLPVMKLDPPEKKMSVHAGQTKHKPEPRKFRGNRSPAYPHGIASEGYFKLLDHPWTAENEPKMDVWLKENNAMLDVFCKALQKPEFFIPLIRIDESQPIVLIPSFCGTIVRPLAEGLRLRIGYSLGIKKSDAALSDWNNLALMSRHLFRGVINGADGMAAIEEPIKAALPLIDSRQLKPEQLRHMIKSLSELPVQFDLTRSIYCERLQLLDLYMAHIQGEYASWNDYYRKGSIPTASFKSMARKRFVRIFPLSKPLEKINLAYDELEKASRSNQSIDWKKQYALPNRLTPSVYVKSVIRSGAWHLLPMLLADSKLWSLEFSDASSMMTIRWRKIQAAKEMSMIAAAIEIFRIEHKDVPKSLDQLKGILGTVPTDPFSVGTPYHYRLDKKSPAGYFIYSVGANGSDDNGVRLQERTPTADDLPLR